MNRRQFVGATFVAVAGCSGRPETDEPTSTDTEPNTPPATAESTARSTPTTLTTEEPLSADLVVDNFHDESVTVSIQATSLSSAQTENVVDFERTIQPDRQAIVRNAFRCDDPCSFRISYDVRNGTDGQTTVDLRTPERTAFSIEINAPDDVQVFPLAR